MATYYIDFAAGSDSNNGTAKATPWKRCKGMTGVTGTAASASLGGGDTVVFKGGVTWTSSFPWTLSAGSGSGRVTYTTDQTWYSGGSWAQPIFSGAQIGTMLNGASYTTLNDTKWINAGTHLAQEDAARCALRYENTSNISITNNTFAPDIEQSIFIVYGSGTYANFTITGNDFSHNASALWFASATAGAVGQNLVYNDNTFHDFSCKLGGDGDGAHGDGALHYFGIPGSDASQYLSGFQFLRNRFYGDFRRGISGTARNDMTAFIYLEGGVQGGVIANNIFSFSPAQNGDDVASIFEAPINFRALGNSRATGVKFWNNTIYSDPTKHPGSAAFLDTFANTDNRNNIIVFGTYGGYGENGNPVGLVNDYNEWWAPNGFITYGTYGSHNIPTGSPYTSNPLFVNANGLVNGDYHLTASSPGRVAGVDLTAAFQAAGIPVADFYGTARSGAWSMGAVQYGASSSPPVGTPVLSVR